jgi:Fe-S cluster biosynthesis and repair protein YggX
MNVKKEVFEKCKKMIEREFSDNQCKLIINRRQINELNKQQRILKSQQGVLYLMVKDFISK